MVVILTRNITKFFVVDEPLSGVDIITIGCEEQLQKRNRLKGLAMQKLVKLIMAVKRDDISLQRIFKELNEKEIQFFIVEKPFKSSNNSLHRKWTYLHVEDFELFEEAWIQQQHINREWKICNHCGQRILARDQFSKKCWKCQKGWFQFSNERITSWHLLERGGRENVLDRLVCLDYIRPIILKKRLDFFRYQNGIFEIYESKNKETSGLTTLDLRSTLIYPFIIHRTGFPVEKFVIIYNGNMTEELQKAIINGYGRNFPFQIELIPIGEYLKINKIQVQKIKVRKNGNSFSYQIVKGSDSKIVIDLTEA